MARIEQLYHEAIAFQRDNGHPYWQDVDLGVVDSDIALGCQYALVSRHHIAGIFSLCPPSAMDQDLWRDRQAATARHINRIIVAREWRGQQLFGRMLAWCEHEMRRLGIGLLRLDTWAASPALVAYYGRHGFALIGERTTATSLALPPQYRGVRLALMEKPVAPATPAP